jgi:DNA repair protein RadC
LAKGIEIQEAASYVEARQFEADRTRISEPEVVKGFLIKQIAHCLEEHFCVLFVDVQLRVIQFEKMFRGTIDSATVHPREVVRAVLDCNAAAVIFAHNHPSGHSAPSRMDVDLTNVLKAALALIDVKVLDHVVVGGADAFSFAENGLI